MLTLIAGLLLFLGVHSLRIFAEPWRQHMRERLGAGAWKGLYALLSLAGFGLLLWGFGRARLDPVLLWSPPPWLRHPAALLLVPAFILLVAAYIPGTRIRAAIGHPMLAGVQLWALAHLLVNGRLHDLVLFGSFLVWSVLAFASARARDRRAGTRYAVQGRGRDAAAIVVGLLACAGFAQFAHLPLIGVQPFGAP